MVDEVKNVEEKPQEPAKPVQQTTPAQQTAPTQPSAPVATNTQPAQSGGSSAGIIIIIVIVILALLGVGGYFGYKYLAKRAAEKIIGISSVTAIPSSLVSATTTVSSVASKTMTSTSGDYIISDSNVRVITDSDLTGLTNWQLKVARNEIYARYGRPFVHKDMQCYFAKKSWYTENPNATNPTLTTTENKNVATILAYEQKVGSNIIDADTGCNTNS